MPAYRKLSLPASKVSGIDIDEKYHFAPGPAPATADLLGTRFGCVICYDRTFPPEYWAVARALGAEVMLAVVSSLGSREDLFLAELQTRALESQTWVIAANRAGPETLNGGHRRLLRVVLRHRPQWRDRRAGACTSIGRDTAIHHRPGPGHRGATRAAAATRSPCRCDIAAGRSDLRCSTTTSG